MRESIKQFVKIVAETLPVQEPIFEFGSLQVPGQEKFADLRPFFPDKNYVGCDYRKGAGVDMVLDLHKTNLSSKSVGTILLIDTLEHVEFPRKALEEMKRILKEDGIIIISSVMNFPIHDYPYDYWRFTPECFKSLLKPFPFSFVDFAGNNRFPHTVIGLGFNKKIISLQDFNNNFEIWKKKWSKWSIPTNGNSWKTIAKLIIPPILQELYWKKVSK